MYQRGRRAPQAVKFLKSWYKLISFWRFCAGIPGGGGPNQRVVT